MSQNAIYLEQPIKSSYYQKSVFTPYSSNYNLINNQSQYQFSNTQPISSNNYLKLNNGKKDVSYYKPQEDNESNYLKERYTKLKDENSELKRKLFDLEREYKLKKGEMEEQVLILRDENSNLQLQIQKAIEKQKVENNISDNIHNENLELINNINILQNDSMILKDDITRKVADIEEKNKIINDLRNEKNVLLNDEKLLKNQIDNLLKDKEILIKQIKDLNETISDKIAPKLKDNENNLSKLQEQVENLRAENEKLKSDNLLLFNENKVQKNLIQILTKQNKKLLGEIKGIYDRDILLMDNMEKMGSNSTNKYKNIFNKDSIGNENLLEEDMEILKDSQKYIEENTDIKFNNNSINDINDNSNESDSIKDNNEDIVKNNIKENKFKNSNLNNNQYKKNNNPLIMNDLVIKKNKESIDIEQKFNLNNKSNKNRIKEKILFNKNLNNDDIDNEKNLKSKTNKSNSNERKKFIKNRNFNLNSQSFTDGNISQKKFNNIDEDIKIENKTLNQNIKPKLLNINIDNEDTLNSMNKDYLYNTDGRINIKSNNDENIEIFKNKFKHENIRIIIIMIIIILKKKIIY